MRKRSILNRLHHYFLPHKRNGYKPHIFRLASVASIVLAVIVLEGAYLTQIKIVFPHTNFLGAVLPGALISLTNEDRAANNLSAVIENTQLTQAAQAAANDMASKGYFSHISPDGKDPWYWLNLVGYKYQYAGQNLAVNFTDSLNVESAWMTSPAHHANIVKPQYTQVGIGVASGMYQGKETAFVVQFFGSPTTVSSQSQKVAVVTASSSVAESAETVTEIPAAKVLGVQTQVIATSPTLTITYILSILAAIICILLIIAIVVKVRIQYVEIIAGGLFILLVLVGLLFFNSKDAPRIQISSEWRMVQ
ncbi:MAG: CAP domain-containing protein [Candidatus Kaiserbacteria bacterium]|nr:CAP domain-containing protein [Candidatus Kaiserbacteria bacterium]